MKKIFFGLLLLILISNFSFAKGSEAQITHVDSSNFPVIEALLRVYNAESIEFKAQDIELFEDKRKIATFTLKPQDFKHYISLVIDRSSSIENAMLKVKKAAAGFIKSLVKDVSFSIISFGSDIDFNHSFSQDVDSLVAEIRKIRPWGGTLLYDAIYDACEDLQANAGLNDLKTVLCITDGKDSTPSGQDQLSARSSEQVIQYAVDKSIRVIAIGLGDEIDPDFLKEISQRTGGWFLHSATADELANLCKLMSARIKKRRHFRIAYQTPDHSLTSNARHLTVKIGLNDLVLTDKRSYHCPNSIKPAQVADEASEGEKPSLKQLLHYLKLPEKEKQAYTQTIRVPRPQPVYGLTLASFKQADRKECRALINHSREQVAAKHQNNLSRQQSFLQKWTKTIDERLNKCYLDVDKPGLSFMQRARMNLLIKFLLLRRKEVELLRQQAYESYMVALKASLEELNYFDATEVLGQPTDESFFDKNAGARAEALVTVNEKYKKLILANARDIEKLFSQDSDKIKETTKVGTQPNQTVPGSIKTFD
jgi:VWFA-related protein